MNKARSGPVLPTLTHFADGTAALGQAIKSALSGFAAPQIDTHREESVFPDGIVSFNWVRGRDRGERSAEFCNHVIIEIMVENCLSYG